MSEWEFWLKLEFRVCHEFRGMRQKELRALWCDGFIPEDYLRSGEMGRVSGRVWIGLGPRVQQQWNFVLLAGRVGHWKELDWHSILPAENVTGWMSVDLERKFMKIHPAAAYPDKDPSP